MTAMSEPEPTVKTETRNAPLRTAIVFSLLFVAAWLPRALVANRYVTVDERGWLYRAGAFYWALANADWANTYRVGHPGVTVMWAGLPAYFIHLPQLARITEIPADYAMLEAFLWRTVPPLEMLISARHVVILIVSLLVAACFLPLQRLFGTIPALVATLFVAWSPFFLSLSITFHPDGLLAVFCLLTVLLTSLWLFGERRYSVVLLSGVVCGLSFLTKTPAIALAVWCAITLAYVELRRQGISWLALQKIAKWFFIWIAAAMVTYFALWPALWVDPVGVFQGILEQNMGHLVSGHALPNYFLSNIVADPGAYFYPDAILYRLSPLTTIGLALAAFAVWKRLPPLQRSDARSTMGALLFFALIFTLVMTAGAKKFDRYVTPAIVAIDVIAAVGWTAVLADAVRRLRPTPRSAIQSGLSATLVLLVVLLHGISGFIHYPYYGLSYNQLLGGLRTAPQVLLIGWGEGLEQAGKWISEQSSGPINVVSWYPEGPLSFYLPSNASTSQFIDDVHYWFDADYLVLYINQIQRMNPDADMINHFLAQEPDLQVSHDGLDLAWVFDLAGTEPPSFTGIHTDTATPLWDGIDLAAYRIANSATAPGENLDITLFLKSSRTISEDLLIHVKLLDPDGAEVWSQRGRIGNIPSVGWPASEVRNDVRAIPVPAHAEAGEYALMVRLEDIESDGSAPSPPYQLAAPVNVQELSAYTVRLVWPPNLTLDSVSHEQAIAAGQSLLTEFTFSGQWTPGTKMSVRLVDAGGKTWAQVDKLVESSVRYELEVPQDAPSGSYDIVAVVYNGDTLEEYANQDEQRMSRVSSVLVNAMP